MTDQLIPVDPHDRDDGVGPAALPTLDRLTRAELTRATHERLRAEDSPTAEEADLRDRLVLLNMPVAESIAARYRNRGVAWEDLSQVALLALVKAAHRFNEASGHDFLSYAVPTIRGEVLRHFRDYGWTIRPPRRIQELQTKIAAAEEELAARIGRTPTSAEMAAYLDEPTTAIDDARSASGCFAPTSLDRPATDGATAVIDVLGADEPGYDAADARVTLSGALARLPARDRRAVMLRYHGGLTQSEIADRLDLTQAQVSRLLARVLAGLRAALAAPEGEPGACQTPLRQRC